MPSVMSQAFQAVRLTLPLVATLLLTPDTAMAQAQAPDAASRWQALNADAIAAYGRGDYLGGITAAEAALTIARDAFGPRHPSTLTNMNNLAVLYESQGRYGDAEPLYRGVLQVRREVQGPRHPSTLTSMNNLAGLYASQARYGDALQLQREALQLRREVLGPRHPDTLTSMNNLARLYESQGRYGDAEPLYREALQLFREVLGLRQLGTLISMNNLAGLYESQGRHGEAEPLYREALQLFREVQGPRHPDTLGSMNNLASLYIRQGRYGDAEPLFREALQLRREVLGPRHPSTLSSMNNLAFLYKSQGQYGEAEPLHREALQLSREVLGPRHPDTLASVSNLAGLYESQGRYGDAEPLFRNALQLRREVQGPRHPDTLSSMNNLALLYESQGRYGDAEPLFREALQLRREVLGPRHPDTLTSMNNLASLYASQRRYGDAEQLHHDALQLRREVLGPRHPSTLGSINNLAGLYVRQGRTGEAESLYREALQLFREVLGPRHPNTLTSMNNLARLYESQARYGEAESLHREALQLSREVLGPRHPSTLTSMNNLAGLYASQGRYGEAEPLYREALRLRREVLGPGHPDTLAVQLNGVGALLALGRQEDAVRQLRAMEPQLLGRLGTELYSNAAAAARRELVASQASYQDMAISLALQPGAGQGALEAAASAVLRFKGMQAEEEAYLGRMVRRGADPKAQALAREIAGLRSQLARLAQGGQPAEVVALVARLEQQELALGQVSRAYQQHLQVRAFSLADLQATLAPGTALLEFREYARIEPGQADFGERRWAALLLTADSIRVTDLGPVAGTREQVETMLGNAGTPAQQADTASALHKRLLGELKASLAGLERLYVAPDGVLHLVPFAALRGADGRRLAETLDLRLVLSGRDLLRPEADQPAKGLLALGGIDFGLAPVQSAEAGSNAPAAPAGPAEMAELLLGQAATAELRERTREALRSGFEPLPETKAEVEAIARQYRSARRDETVEVWQGAEADEARLKRLARPPRVLHLATHGFYRPATRPQDRPMLLSGVALAGANQALAASTEDGILYAIEAQDLNLEGTELVVLSACQTAQGQIEYGEGLSGLVRALRTAGARQVLVTLQPVGDQRAADYMARFYHHWLSQTGRSNPAAALRAAQQEAIADQASQPSPDHTWTLFTMIGG